MNIISIIVLLIIIIMMASSQVEIAPSSPFAVHNPRRRDPCFNQLVIPNDNTNSSSSSSSRHIDLWVHQPQWQTQTTTTKTTPNNDTNSNNNNDDNRGKNNDKHKHKQKQTDDKWARAREIVFDHHRHPKPERLVDEEVSNLRGVSSLVQKWRGFEAEAKFSGNRTSNTINSPDNVPPVLMTSTSAGGGGEDDPFGEDWESSSTTTNVAFSAPASSRGRDSDATEIERLRVADIIRKLTDDVVTSSESPPRPRTSVDQTTTATAEQRCCFSLSSPRIRGRQAYNDLLTQMERDKQNELQGLLGRKPVSKFSHRGRIQALLRFRFLRRGSMMEPPPHPQQGRPSNTTIQSHNKPMPSPALVHLRERVDPCAQNVSDPAAAATSLYQQGKENESNQLITNSVESCLRQDEDFDHRETSPLSRFMSQETNYESSNESLDRTFQNKEEEEETATLVQINNFTAQETNYDDELRGDCDDDPHKVSEELNNNNNNINMFWVSDVSHPEVGWQELHSDYQQQGNSTDWIDEVSRPRSDWEDLRQARYQEMLDPFVDNEEIRALLGRRSVSTFLSSGLRERIDRVMISRSEGKQSDLKSNNQTPQRKDERLPEQEEHEQEEEALVSEEDTEQDAQGGGYGDYFDEYEEAESSVGQQYDECDDYADNVTASPAPSWPQNQAHDLCDYSYQAASPCTQQSSSYYSQDNAPNSSYRSQPAIEMELIYDLRGHMEQLHQEMSELRKSIKCCMDMQMKMQRSIKNEVANAVALNHSDPKNGGRKPVKRVTSGGRCCICCKMQVDSLLYRCGHMCTCFKCAHELQWSSGKCPICRAPILDVVRTYSNHSSYKPI
ncbi:hypothetical protein ABFS83_13G193400 [Erythranthe nasuta]